MIIFSEPSKVIIQDESRRASMLDRVKDATIKAMIKRFYVVIYGLQIEVLTSGMFTSELDSHIPTRRVADGPSLMEFSMRS